MQKYELLRENPYLCALNRTNPAIMACILCIETSTNVCSAALCRDGEVLFNREDRSGPNHAERLGTYVDQALSYSDGRHLTIDAVAVSGGPGSYTGLRIGVSMAKGLCYGRDLPLVAVPTLLVLSAAAGRQGDALLCPMLDARRMEVYAALYDGSLREVRPIHADIVDGDTYHPWLDEGTVCFFGNGAAKCMDVISHPNARLLRGIEPLASNMGVLAGQRLAEGKTEDVAYYEPFYLKAFVAGKPKTLLTT